MLERKAEPMDVPQSYGDWIKQAQALNQDNTTKPQETVVEEQTQENPAVSKLREAFDAAKNAIVEGTELAKIVHDLQGKVLDLGNNVLSLQRDLEYTRSRNKELDEQVTEVRRQRDNAISEGLAHKDRADSAEAAREQLVGMVSRLNTELENALNRIRTEQQRADEAQLKQMELEDQLKSAQAKLGVIEGLFGKSPQVEANPKPVPHYLEQPRDEVGKFQPFDEGKSYPHGSQGESSF